ncbi:MAG: nicotinate phosphoribosyltransferase [Candidatus Omnitrophica bacterium]|nr:nicotinate phosphoribosyltransferase [Candidatus Omnitrophota bacterium]
MNQNLELFLDLYELTMAEVYFKYKPHTLATFDLFVRQLPLNRNYLLVCGLSEIIDFVSNLRFDRNSIEYLREKKLFSKEFLDYLKNFRFQGDLWMLPEGEVCFAGEPILRIEANIIEAQILETFLLNTINLQTMIATKASRVVIAAKDKAVYDFSLRRTAGKDAGIKVSRSAYVAGFSGTSNVLAGFLYNIPLVGTMAHSFVMAFKTELESFSAYTKIFPHRSILLVDTYNTEKGIQNAIKIGLELKRKGFKLSGIRLDSGDIVFWSKKARFMLDKAGLNYTQILASGNLDEYKIEALLKSNPPIDSFGVGTHMGTSSDSPYLDVIYKLSQISYDKKNFLPTMKLSQGKTTYPGRKQIFRISDRDGFFVRDIIALEEERPEGRPLLIRAIKKGQVLYKSPSLERIREFAKDNIRFLPDEYKRINKKVVYPVSISQGLKGLTWILKRKLKHICQ